RWAPVSRIASVAPGLEGHHVWTGHRAPLVALATLHVHPGGSFVTGAELPMRAAWSEGAAAHKDNKDLARTWQQDSVACGLLDALGSISRRACKSAWPDTAGAARPRSSTA